jgi:hypothetical protein
MEARLSATLAHPRKTSDSLLFRRLRRLSPWESPSPLATATPSPAQKATLSGDPPRISPCALTAPQVQHSRERQCVSIARSSLMRLRHPVRDGRPADAQHLRQPSGVARHRTTARHRTKKPTQTAGSTPSKTASSSSDYATRSDWADAVLDELNAERADHGLPHSSSIASWFPRPTLTTSLWQRPTPQPPAQWRGRTWLPCFGRRIQLEHSRGKHRLQQQSFGVRRPSRTEGDVQREAARRWSSPKHLEQEVRRCWHRCDQ